MFAARGKAGKSVRLGAEEQERCVEELRRRMQLVTPLPDEPHFATQPDTYVARVVLLSMAGA